VKALQRASAPQSWQQAAALLTWAIILIAALPMDVPGSSWHCPSAPDLWQHSLCRLP
jgi:hypothetical protein